MECKVINEGIRELLWFKKKKKNRKIVSIFLTEQNIQILKKYSFFFNF
jgi:hypothetical protein